MKPGHDVPPDRDTFPCDAITLYPIDRDHLLVQGRTSAPGMEDMDWTEPCLERGTKFSFSVYGMSADDIPVVRAWVDGGIFYYEGYVSWSAV